MSLSLFFLVLLLLLFFTFYPLFKKYDYIEKLNNHNEIKIYRKNLLNQMKELDFEKEMGIISDEDYKFIKNSLLIEISKLIKE